MGMARNLMVANTKKFVPSTSALECFYLALTSRANARLQETFRAAKNLYLSQSGHHCRSRLQFVGVVLGSSVKITISSIAAEVHHDRKAKFVFTNVFN
jgi:hypothetical protein